MLRGQPFNDRRDAGRQLAAALPELDPATTVVIALPRGGVPVAEEICNARHLPLDLVLVRKIGVPRQPEVAAGAIVDGAPAKVFVNQQVAKRAGLSEETVRKMGQDLLPEIERRKAQYLKGFARPDLAGKTLVVVDDGVATGATLKASLQALCEMGPKRVILALPTAPSDTLKTLTQLADEIICLHQPELFLSVGTAYRYFPQVSDKDVIEAMQRCAASDG
ncbi:MAG: phosphoribosyltransferase [Silicimonas sp.]|nr:phosphoribosyltransferase [Silicimonas sp.]